MKSASIATIITVPLKFVLILIFFIRVLFLENISEGFDIYLTGEHNVTFGKRYEDIFIWTDALAETFLSLNLCLGIMTAYGSYNSKTKPVIRHNFIIAFVNTGVNLILGAAVYCCIGYLRHKGNPASVRAALYQLGFIGIPAALGEMPGGNFWSIIFFLMLFTIGVDTVSSMIEAISTAFHDTQYGKKVDRMYSTGVI